jgi:hypothetical protein
MSARDSGSRERAAFDLPATVDLDSVNQAEIEIIRLATRRTLGSKEALRFSRMLDHRRRAIADRTFEQQMDEIIKLRKERNRT